VIRPALLLLALLGALLLGCTDPEQARICGRVFGAVVSDTAAVETRAAGERVVEARGEGRVLACRFADAAYGARRDVLLGVTVDGAPLRETALYLLQRELDLPIAAPEAEAAPEPAGFQAALLAQRVLDGLTIGGLYALLALAISLVYGATAIVNLAFAEILMIGGMATLMLAPLFGLALPPLLWLPPVAALAVGIGAAYGWAGHRLVFRRLASRAGTVAPLVAALFLGIALQNAVRALLTPNLLTLQPVAPAVLPLYTGGGFEVTLPVSELGLLGVTAVIAAAIAWTLLRTRHGRAYRACVADGRAAALMGIDTVRVTAASFAAGGGLAGFSGAAVAVLYGTGDFYMGTALGFHALTAAVLGGLGNPLGALAGGVALGLFEALWASYIDGASVGIASFALLILTLIFRPEGLFGFAPTALEADRHLR